MTAGRKPRDWSPAQEKRIRNMVESGEFNVAEIARHFRCSEHEVRRLTNEHGWVNPNAEQVKPKPNRGVLKPPPNGISPWSRAKFEAAKRKEIADLERRLYGALIDDVQWLRRRGYGVNKERGGYRVGNKVMDAEALRNVADRERRLAGVAA